MSGRVDFLLRRAKPELSPGAGPVPLKQPRSCQSVVSPKGCVTASLLRGPVVSPALEPSYPLQPEATAEKT